MPFDADNKVFQLCAEGMDKEASGSIQAATDLYNEAWQLAQNDFEAFTVAHYMARNQENPSEELKWNLEALARANKVTSDEMNKYFPSLYLNTGKSYERIGDSENAMLNYKQAESFINFLDNDGYGKMIAGGIASALERLSQKLKHK